MLTKKTKQTIPKILLNFFINFFIYFLIAPITTSIIIAPKTTPKISVIYPDKSVNNVDIVPVMSATKPFGKVMIDNIVFFKKLAGKRACRQAKDYLPFGTSPITRLMT